MIKNIIKRDGSVEPFSPEKLNRWSEWAADTLGDAVDWSSVVMEAVSFLPEECQSTLLQRQLIETCLNFDSWAYNRMAGRLYAANIRKEVYPQGIPTIRKQFKTMAKLGYMKELNYTNEQYKEMESVINHDRDFEYSHYQLHAHFTKYCIMQRTTNTHLETSQFMYMRMAMALAEDQPEDRKMEDAKEWYRLLSNNIINAPTPYHVNLGTSLMGFASCCLYTSGDTAKSIAVGNHIAATMTYMSAGIGTHFGMRSLNDPVRNGTIRHLGKLPYMRALVGEVKASLQNSRGGAATGYLNIYDPEIATILNLKNPLSTEDKKIRGMDYSWGYNKFFVRKVAKNEDIFLFNSFTAPDLYKALYSNNEDKFEKLYNKYEADPNFKKTYVNARDIFLQAENQLNETGRIYQHNIHEMNSHTPFTETIYSSNLCAEISLPTKPYNDMTELYSDTVDNAGEVAMCSLAGINVPNINNDEDYEKAAYYALLMIDKAINMAHYELPQIGITAKARMSAGVGIIGLAYYMAKNHKKYSTLEGKHLIHEVAEKHAYYLIKASLQLGKELGNAPWIDKTKWKKGWLPIDSYNKNVDSIADFRYKYDWEALRKEIIAHGGIRNSALIAHMPSESSANASGVTNGLYPIRDFSLMKTDNERVNYWVAPDAEELKDWYEIAWDLPARDLIHMYAIVQKFTDQAISADFYRTVIGDTKIQSVELITNFLDRVKYGLKTHYYLNQRTTNGNAARGITESDVQCDSCTL